jgi:hypothetical protein
MSGITLDHLKILLKEQQEKEKKEKEIIVEASPSVDTKEAIQEFYQHHGIIGPMKGIWKRPIPDSVYKCPLSEPMTTLVQWDSLPRSIQNRYKKPEDGTHHGVVEVNRNDLMAEEVVLREEGGDINNKGGDNPSSSSLTNGLQRRPLGGNLTNKLTEYTRGKTGQAKPFIPGGLDAEEVAGLTGNNSTTIEGGGKINNPYLTPEAIERSLRVLTQGSKASWRDGSLITAPPGVDFKVGLSYEDIYGKDDDDDEAKVETNTMYEEKTEENDDEEEENLTTSPKEFTASTDNNSQRITTTRAVQWDQNFLDDDSLFGSSVGDSDSDSDDDEDTIDDEDDDNVDENEVNDETKSDPLSSKEKSTTDNTGMTDEEEIDQLLTEFSHAEARTKNEIIRKEQNDDDGTANNPLRLAEHQAKLQHDTKRKSWASTALLPIDDFHSYIPNPAMRYPFTLDTFQQQAVARLERNESVFVAAHTSAGKTVVAEYAVSLAKQRGTRCIYTSPVRNFPNEKVKRFLLNKLAYSIFCSIHVIHSDIYRSRPLVIRK